jgi:hypothetical protein
MLMEADLPSDVEALRALVLEQAPELDALKVFQAEVERKRRRNPALLGGAIYWNGSAEGGLASG